MGNFYLGGITAVVHCTADVEPQRLRNCLLGIEKQEFDKDQVDIVVGCLRKENDDLSVLRSLSAEVGASVVSMINWSPGVNTALMRNLGARRAERLVTAFVDVDSVMDPEVFSRAYPLVASGECAIFAEHMHMNNPPEDIIYRLSKEEFRLERDKSTFHDSNVGGCVFLLTEHIQAVRGYDERMFGWGAEDHDILGRVGRYGHPRLDTLHALNMHQHHEKRPWRQTPFFERNQQIQLETELVREGGNYVNKDSWGGIRVNASHDEVRLAPLDLNPEDGPMGRVKPNEILKALGVSEHKILAQQLGHEIRISEEERTALLPLLWEKKAFDVRLIANALRVRVVWDVGAMCGLYSLWAATAFPGCIVHCFEPFSVLAAVAYENLKPHMRTHVHLFGLSGNTTGMVPVNAGTGSDGRLSFDVVGCANNPKEEWSTHAELFCCASNWFKRLSESQNTDVVDIIRFGRLADPNATLDALAPEQLANVRFVQTEGVPLSNSAFSQVGAEGPRGILCFRNIEVDR